MCRNADSGIDREAAVLVGQHVFGLTTLQQAPTHKTQVSVKTNLYSSYVATKGAQYAPAQGYQRLGYHGLIDQGGGVQDHR